jgi:hypothetical protein
MRTLGVLIVGISGSVPAQDLKLHQIQVIGTHNSYHIAPAGGVKALIQSTRKGWFEAIDYTHRPLAEQFGTLGIRQIELDVFADPDGGLFAKPAGRAMAKGDPGPDPNADGELAKPGFKVLHVQDVDFRTTVPTFAGALSQIVDWSAKHPAHVPIMVLVELKDSPQPLLPTKPLPFTAERLGEIDQLIRDTIPAKQRLEPASCLPLEERGWPTLAAARGKILFVLDNEGKIGELYRQRRDPAMFAQRPESDPLAAFFKINEPVKEFDRIQSLVKKGYLVRTRADADTAEARTNDPTRRDKAFASGAQFVSTDFPEARPEISPYVVQFAGKKTVRVNPVSAMGEKTIDP